MEDGRADRLQQRQAFWFAWVFMVLVVAIGFFVQKRTIDRLAEDEARITYQIEQTRQRTTNNAESLCGLLLNISDTADWYLIQTTFRDLGYSCDISS